MLEAPPYGRIRRVVLLAHCAKAILLRTGLGVSSDEVIRDGS